MHSPIRSFLRRFSSKTKLFYTAGFATAAVSIGTISNDDNIVVGAKGLARFIRSLRIGLSISVDYYFSMLGLTESAPNYHIMMSRIHQRSAERIRDGCLFNGGTYVKLGQGLVSMSHILPKEYIVTLKVLQDKCLMRDKQELYQVFEEDLKNTPEALFEAFDPIPIASASIAQVFKATTKEGKTVAVKVQYNDLQKRLNSDVMTINFLLTVGAFIHPKVDFTWILNDFVQALKQELDFINEGMNGERCAKDLKQFKYIHVPEVFWKYTTTRILVTEFIEGIKISEVQTLKDQKYSLADLNNKLFEAFGHQIFQTGFVHADPHPGNVLVRRHNGQAQLIILDHGLYQKIADNDRIALSHLWKAIVFSDRTKMKFYAKNLGVDDYELFAEILTQIPLRSMGFQVKAKLTKEEEEYMRRVASERFDLIVDCLQQMPRTLLLVLRNLNTIRAISYDHGCPINRYAVLARIAAKAAFVSGKHSLLERLSNLFMRFLFEVNLSVQRLIIYWRTLILTILYKTGLTPDITAMMEETARKL